MKPEILLALRGFKANKTIFVIIVIALVMGTTNYIIGDAFLRGVEDFMYGTYIEIYRGDIILRPRENAEFIENIDSKIDKIRTLQGVKGVSPRLDLYGEIRKGNRKKDVDIIGMTPSDEKIVSQLDKAVVEGSFLTDNDKSNILIGRYLATDLEIALGDTVQLTFPNDEMREYRVKGILQTVGIYNTRTVFMVLDQFQDVMSVGNLVNWVLISLNDMESHEDYKLLISQQGINDKIRTAEEEFPGFVGTVKVITNTVRLLVILSLVIGALMESTLFYVNVISKKRVIAILKAIGSKHVSIMSVYIFQGLIYGVIASFIGVILGFLVTSYLEVNPLFIAKVGRDLIISFDIYSAVVASAITIFVSIMASLYPAYMAAKTDVVEAMRT